jgi:hypothetical protein
MEAETCRYRPDQLTEVAAVIPAVIILIPEIQDDSDNRNCANDLHIFNMMGIIELFAKSGHNRIHDSHSVPKSSVVLLIHIKAERQLSHTRRSPSFGVWLDDKCSTNAPLSVRKSESRA